MSFHGNTLATLSCAYHPIRRAPYADILDDQHFYHVSPAYAKRFQKHDETEKQYVERLRQELEDKFHELGPESIIGCKRTYLSDIRLIIKYLTSRRGDSGWGYHWCRRRSKGLFQRYISPYFDFDKANVLY